MLRDYAFIANRYFVTSVPAEVLVDSPLGHIRWQINRIITIAQVNASCFAYESSGTRLAYFLNALEINPEVIVNKTNFK